MGAELIMAKSTTNNLMNLIETSEHGDDSAYDKMLVQLGRLIDKKIAELGPQATDYDKSSLYMPPDAYINALVLAAARGHPRIAVLMLRKAEEHGFREILEIDESILEKYLEYASKEAAEKQDKNDGHNIPYSTKETIAALKGIATFVKQYETELGFKLKDALIWRDPTFEINAFGLSIRYAQQPPNGGVDYCLGINRKDDEEFAQAMNLRGDREQIRSRSTTGPNKSQKIHDHFIAVARTLIDIANTEGIRVEMLAKNYSDCSEYGIPGNSFFYVACQAPSIVEFLVSNGFPVQPDEVVSLLVYQDRFEDISRTLGSLPKAPILKAIQRGLSASPEASQRFDESVRRVRSESEDIHPISRIVAETLAQVFECVRVIGLGEKSKEEMEANKSLDDMLKFFGLGSNRDKRHRGHASQERERVFYLKFEDLQIAAQLLTRCSISRDDVVNDNGVTLGNEISEAASTVFLKLITTEPKKLRSYLDRMPALKNLFTEWVHYVNPQGESAVVTAISQMGTLPDGAKNREAALGLMQEYIDHNREVSDGKTIRAHLEKYLENYRSEFLGFATRIGVKSSTSPARTKPR